MRNKLQLVLDDSLVQRAELLASQLMGDAITEDSQIKDGRTLGQLNLDIEELQRVIYSLEDDIPAARKLMERYVKRVERRVEPVERMVADIAPVRLTVQKDVVEATTKPTKKLAIKPSTKAAPPKAVEEAAPPKAVEEAAPPKAVEEAAPPKAVEEAAPPPDNIRKYCKAVNRSLTDRSRKDGTNLIYRCNVKPKKGSDFCGRHDDTSEVFPDVTRTVMPSSRR
jgi:hypothetical protein